MLVDMTRRPTVIQAAGATGLAIGLAIGGYGFASAASPGGPSSSPPAAPGAAAAPARPGLAAAAQAIGIPVADLQQELAAGKTIAAVAGEHHVPVSSVIDAMVGAAQPGLRDRITGQVNGTMGPRPGMRPFGRANLGVAASVLGLTPTALRDALMGGQSLAQVATSNGVDPQKLIDALVADQTAKLDQSVKAGRLTQAQEDRLKATLPKRVADQVNGVRGPGGARRPRRAQAPQPG